MSYHNLHPRHHQHHHNTLDSNKDVFHEVITPTQFTVTVLGVFMLGVIVGILLSAPSNRFLHHLQHHIVRAKVHPDTPLERQRMKVSINQKLTGKVIS